jgi:putative tryptophan/tyrosine transport system substrate-binding protein
VRRRELIILLGSAAAWPLAGHAQQPERLRRVGVLLGFRENDPFTRAILSAFTQALTGFGWQEGRNIRIDYRFAAGDPALYKTYAAELVGLMPDAILASPGTAVAALREQTRTIPIVFALLPDPVAMGVVQSLARPGGNITGFTSFDAPIIGKWLQLLKEVAPIITRVAIIFNPDTTTPVLLDMINRAVEDAAASLGVTVTLAPVRDDAAIEEAIAAQGREPGGSLICLPDSFNVAHRGVIIAAAARHGLPLIGTIEFPRAGGLMSYIWNSVDQFAPAASYIARILEGANPADLPVQQPTKYSLIINLKTAKALGLTVPPSVLDIADEVIE